MQERKGIMPSDFYLPRFEGPLDLPERIARLPEDSSIRGMFLQVMVDAAEKRSGVRPGGGDYIPFKEYPTREGLQLCAESASLAYPEVSPREGVRRLGQLMYAAFCESHIGSVMTSFGGEFEDVLQMVPKIYEVSLNGASAELLEFSEDRAIVALRGVWLFPDVYQLGCLEGFLETFQKSGRVLVRVLSMCDVDLMLEWVDDAEAGPTQASRL